MWWNIPQKGWLLLWFPFRLRAHSCSGAHSTSMAGPLHWYIETAAGGVLRLPRATEGPRLSEWGTILKHEISLSHGVNSHFLSSFPLWIHWDIFPGTQSAERRPKQAEKREVWPVGMHGRKTCRNNERLYINQFPKRHAKTIFKLQTSAQQDNPVNNSAAHVFAFPLLLLLREP